MTVSFVGDEVSFICYSSTSLPIRWLHRISSSSTGLPTTVFNGYTINPLFTSRFAVHVQNVTGSDATSSTLSIRQTQLTDAGMFFCQELTFDGTRPNDLLKFDLNVYDPKCFTRPTLTNDRLPIDVLAIDCQVGYRGTATTPSITCLPVVHREVVSTNETDNLVTYVKTIDEPNGVNMSAIMCNISSVVDGTVFTRHIWNSTLSNQSTRLTSPADSLANGKLLLYGCPVVVCVALIVAVCCFVKRYRRHSNNNMNGQTSDQSLTRATKGNLLSQMYSLVHKPKTIQSKSAVEDQYAYINNIIQPVPGCESSNSRYFNTPEYATLGAFQADEDSGHYAEI